MFDRIDHRINPIKNPLKTSEKIDFSEYPPAESFILNCREVSVIFAHL